MATQPTYPLKSNCPQCGSSNINEKFFTQGFTILRCAQCTLQFVGEDLSAEELVGYYEATDYDPVYDDDDNDALLSHYYHSCLNLISQYHQSGKLLDIGCARGQFLDTAGDNWDRHGIEITSNLAQQAQQRYGDKVFQGTLADYNLEADFDVITMMDVLDHSRNPQEDLNKCYELLKPGGIVIVKVHNIECLWAKVTGPKFYAVVPPFHLFYFSKKTLDDLLSRCGFNMVDAKYIGQKIAIKNIPFRLSQNNEDSIFHWLHLQMAKTSMGDWSVTKNLNDIITVVGVKQ